MGIEHNAEKVDAERAAGRNVKVGDATDKDFWSSIRAAKSKNLIMLAMPSPHINVRCPVNPQHGFKLPGGRDCQVC